MFLKLLNQKQTLISIIFLNFFILIKIPTVSSLSFTQDQNINFERFKKEIKENTSKNTTNNEEKENAYNLSIIRQPVIENGYAETPTYYQQQQQYPYYYQNYQPYQYPNYYGYCGNNQQYYPQSYYYPYYGTSYQQPSWGGGSSMPGNLFNFGLGGGFNIGPPGGGIGVGTGIDVNKGYKAQENEIDEDYNAPFTAQVGTSSDQPLDKVVKKKGILNKWPIANRVKTNVKNWLNKRKKMAIKRKVKTAKLGGKKSVFRNLTNKFQKVLSVKKKESLEETD
uniref:DUF148 domain-containing protein n=1 Tax=Meloidogyne hapla TaxID=6305 RepID=A0A1I8BK61_MELHA